MYEVGCRSFCFVYVHPWIPPHEKRKTAALRRAWSPSESPARSSTWSRPVLFLNLPNFRRFRNFRLFALPSLASHRCHSYSKFHLFHQHNQHVPKVLKAETAARPPHLPSEVSLDRVKERGRPFSHSIRKFLRT